MQKDCAPAPAGKTGETLQDKFCAVIAPAVERHAAIAFRGRGREAVMEAQGACVALAWKWHVRLAERGKDATTFPTVIADLAVKHVRAGRGICGQRTRDVMSKVAQQRHGFSIGKLPDYSSLSSNPLEAALVDNHVTPPPDAAAFRIDFPEWLARWNKRDRNMILDLAQGERTLDAAGKYHVSPGRVSQMRREAAEDWERFHGQAA